MRLLKKKFYESIAAAEAEGADGETLKNILGKGRAKKGMFEGNLEEGELEIGQVSALINEIKPAAKIVKEIWDEYCAMKEQIAEK